MACQSPTKPRGKSSDKNVHKTTRNRFNRFRLDYVFHTNILCCRCRFLCKNKLKKKTYMKKKNKWIIRILVVIVAFAFSAILLILAMYDARYGYHYPNSDFVDNGKEEPYARNIPLHEMDFSIYTQYFPDAIAPISFAYNEMVVLPCDVDYYEKKEDTEPALTLAKGTQICVRPDTTPSPMSLTGYGLECWPDYEEEWRYGCPFITENVFYTIEEHQKYYVKTEQLEKVARAWFQENIKYFRYYYTPWDAPKEMTQGIDRELYEAGAFCPDRWK